MYRLRSSFWLWLLSTALVLPAFGCVGFTSHLLWVIQGRRLPAEFAGLEGKRVAIVCLSEGISYGTDAPAGMLAGGVEEILMRRVKGIDVVPRDDIEDWIDRNGWDEIDYKDVGLGVDADMVVAIDLKEFTMHEGTGLYQGRASLVVTVYDMSKEGRVVFRRTTPEYIFPTNGPRFATETSESKFRRAFVRVLAMHTSRYFFAYDMDEEFFGESRLDSF